MLPCLNGIPILRSKMKTTARISESASEKRQRILDIMKLPGHHGTRLVPIKFLKKFPNSLFPSMKKTFPPFILAHVVVFGYRGEGVFRRKIKNTVKFSSKRPKKTENTLRLFENFDTINAKCQFYPVSEHGKFTISIITETVRTV